MQYEVSRGEIHFVENRNAIGHEMAKSRPAVVVSNNQNNMYAPTIEVVYMTTQPKKDMPTHVYINSTSNGKGEGSTVLCEQIYTIDKRRLQEDSYMARVTDEEMERIDEALIISLGLEEYIAEYEEIEYEDEPDEDDTEEYMDMARETTITQKDEELAALQEELTAAKNEVKFYKKQYKDMLERIMQKAGM